MPSSYQQKQQQDLVIRLEQLKSLFTQIQPEIEQLSFLGELAPKGAGIVRYQALLTRRDLLVLQVAISLSYFCDQRWKKVLPSCHKYIGKAGSPAYLKAVEKLVRRTKIEGLQQVLHTLELGLSDKRGRSGKASKGLRIC